MKITTFISFLLVAFVAQICTWLQLNAQFIDAKYKNHPIIILAGIPITWLYLKATSLGVDSFNGELWPQRLITFATGIMIFTLMTYLVLGETLNTKNTICLLLAIGIILIQILIK